MYTKIESEEEACEFLDMHLGILNKSYLHKIKGQRLPFGTQGKIQTLPTYQKSIKRPNVEEIKQKLSEVKLKKIVEKEAQKAYNELKYHKQRETIVKIHQKLSKEKLMKQMVHS